MWVVVAIIIIIIVALYFKKTIKSEDAMGESALTRLMNIDPKMNPIVTGVYAGSAVGVSQTNQKIYIRKFYINNKQEEVFEIPLSALVGIDIELEPKASGLYTEASFCDLIFHYTYHHSDAVIHSDTCLEKRFKITKGDAEQVRKALLPIIRQKIESHNAEIAKAAGMNTEIIEVTVIDQSQPSTSHRVKAYVANNVLGLEEIATSDNMKFQLFSTRVPLSDIVAFEQIGDVHYTTDVSGGGSSLTGAIIGGVIAGSAGAIIGSRQEITSSTRQIDDRATVLKYRNGAQISQILFSYDDYFLLHDLIQ